MIGKERRDQVGEAAWYRLIKGLEWERDLTADEMGRWGGVVGETEKRRIKWSTVNVLWWRFSQRRRIGKDLQIDGARKFSDGYDSKSGKEI